MGLITNHMWSVLLAALLSSSLAADLKDTRWSRRISDQSSSSSSDWVPIKEPCPLCSSNIDRITPSASDQVAALLTPPLPDFQQVPSFLPNKQFRETRLPVAQKLVQQSNGHQHFPTSVIPEGVPKFQHVIKSQSNIIQNTDSVKKFVEPKQPHFIQPTGTDQFVQQQEFNAHQNFPPFPQENLNAANPALTSEQYQQFLGQFFRSQESLLPPPQVANLTENPLFNEEKPDIQLVYVPVEALKNRGRFNIPHKSNVPQFTELKTGNQLRQEPSALAAEETRQQRQHFQQYVEQPSPQLSTGRPVLKQDEEIQQQFSQQVVQVQAPQITQDQQTVGQQLIHSLRALPPGVPQQLPPLQLQEQRFLSPIELAQHQQQQQQVSNEGHFFQALRPIPHSQQTPVQHFIPPTTQAPRLVRPTIQEPPSNQESFLQFLRPLSTEIPIESSEAPTETQRPLPTRVPQRSREPTPSSAPQLESETIGQQPLKQISSTPKPEKPVPHQPPLSVYMGKKGHDVKITDVIKVLKNAKTIAVLDSVGPESPQVFVGPSNLKPPLSYAKFELPYLSSIESNRVERRVEEFPFFVAPLNFKTPRGYSKIPFPAPHIGSVVVSNINERDESPVEVSSPKPTRGRFTTQYQLPTELPAINPQLPTLVNSLQDTRQQSSGFTSPAQQQIRRPQHIAHTIREEEYVQTRPLQDSNEPSDATHLRHFLPNQQLPSAGRFSDFQHVSTTPRSQQVTQSDQLFDYQQVSTTPQTHNVPESNHFFNYQQISTTPRSQPVHQQNRFANFPKVSTPQITSTQYPQFPHSQNILPAKQFPPPRPSSETPQFVQYNQAQFPLTNSQPPLFPTQLTQTASPEEQTLPPSPEEDTSQTSFTPQFQQESNRVSQSPEIQQYIQGNSAANQPIQTVEETPEELPTAPPTRASKRRPTYRTRQRTTEAPATEEPYTTSTRRPTARRRPNYVRQRQETETHQDRTTTSAPQIDVEPSSTTEFVRTASRQPARSFQDQRFNSNRVTAQEEAPKRTNVPRTRTRTRERNSHRVTGQTLPSQRQTTESPEENYPKQLHITTPSHESRRQHQSFSPNYNTERSGFEEPTTELNRVEVIQNQNKQQIAIDDNRAVYHQAGLHPQFVSTISPQRQTFTDDFFPDPAPQQARFHEINSQLSSTPVHSEIQSFEPQHLPETNANSHHLVQSKPVNEEQSSLPQFTVPVQVSVPGRTEKPEVEETPRPVYVRIRGRTRGNRPTSSNTQTNNEGQKAGVQQPTNVQDHRVEQNQQRVVQNFRNQAGRKRIPQPVEVKEDAAQDKPTSGESEEYGFTRSVSFAAPNSHTEDKVRDTISYSQGSQESAESIESVSPTTVRTRQNFLVRQRKPTETSSPSPATTVYTVRPSRRPQVVKQQVRLTSVRSRIRRPTTSSTTEEPPAQEENYPPVQTRFTETRQNEKFPPPLAFNEVRGDSISTPRSSLQRYNSQISNGDNLQRQEPLNEDSVIQHAVSTPSTFQITLLDEPQNYPRQYDEQYRGQGQFETHHRPADLTSLNSDNLPKYSHDDPEGGAESQWATKRLPYAQPDRTTPLVSFTTEFPAVEQTITEASVNVNYNKSDLEFSAETEMPHGEPKFNNTNTDSLTTEFPADILKVEEQKIYEKELTQKKAGDHNLEKKTAASRRGTWVRVRKVQRNPDLLEAAESQNFGALSTNQIRLMASKGSHSGKWSSPLPQNEQDQTVFEVPKISSAETYSTVNENAGEESLPTYLETKDMYNADIEYTDVDKEAVIITTTETAIATDRSNTEDVTTIYITPPPFKSDPNARDTQDIINTTTDSPSIETTTPLFEPIKQTEDHPSLSTGGEAIKFEEARNDFEIVSKPSIEEIQTDPQPTIPENAPSSPNKDQEEEIIHFKTENTSNQETQNKDQETELVTEIIEVEDKTTQINTNETVTNEKSKETLNKEEQTPPINETVSISKEDNKESEKVIKEPIVKTEEEKEKDRTNHERLLIQSSVRDAIQQNTPTEGTTVKPLDIDPTEVASTTTELIDIEVEPTNQFIQTSTRTEVSHETEICYKGRCVKTKTPEENTSDVAPT